MAKKKNKDVDFKKTKLKVGKVRKSGNLTKPTFKTSKVTLKEALDLRQDAVKSICNANGGSSVKILKLNRLLETEQSVNHLTIDLLNVVARMIIDNDKRVRELAIKYLKKSLTTLKKSDVNEAPSISLILSHVRCALTHLDASIADDGRKFLLMLHELSCVSSIQEQMLTILLTKVTQSMNDTVVSDRSLDELQVLHKILSSDNKGKQQQQQQEEEEEETRSVAWCERQSLPRAWLFPRIISHYSLDALDSFDEAFKAFEASIQRGTPDATIFQPVQRRLACVIEKMLHSYLKGSEGTLTLSPLHGRHLLMLLRIRQLLVKKPILLPHSLPTIEVIADVSTTSSSSNKSTSSFGEKKAKNLNNHQRKGKLQSATASNKLDHLKKQLVQLLLDQTSREKKTGLLLPSDRKREGKKKQVTFKDIIDADAN